MKLSKLYSNKPELFGPIDFRSGLNVVLAEIRLPDNRDKDTHNLGKTTLGRLIDYGFLVTRDPKFFLFKNEALFSRFVFFLEIELADASYVTVRRGVEEATKISFKKHEASHQDFADLAEEDWDHFGLPFERAREMLDGLLDLRGVSPWDFRKGLGYQLRGQDDFQDVFQLRRFGIGAHKDWKPYVAHILGFDHSLVQQHYEKQEKLEEAKSVADTVKAELGGTVDDVSKIEGILQLKLKEAEKKQKLLDAFDFRQQDKERTKQVVEDIDARIGALNTQRYSLSQNRRKIAASLEEDQILFNPSEAQRLFQEVGVLFAGQIKRDFDQLIAFNRAITDERRGYLIEEYAEVEAEIKGITTELNTLGKRRSDLLSFLSATDVFAKYKQVTDELVTLRADIETLERQRGFLRRLQDLRTNIRKLSEDRTHLQSQIEANVEAQSGEINSLFSSIRLYFSDIIEEVTSHKALLSVYVNKEGHLEFKAEVLDDAGKATSADLGHTYRKLLCIAFDLAVLRAHLDQKFPRFVFHDGVFESLDDRKKANLLAVIRQYADLGLQPIITLIDSDAPPPSEDGTPVFSIEEIVVRLHDEGDEGRLFRMKAW
ncbi:DUF2326 domain-containing protein [Ideonella azotifigens]|uniref:DUF2326 domain-containing protein n=1 Tax=Ideonella azotifigens TaxID=513160 RepID=A0ABN1JKI6_9BURK|nr:DUF2326 domain-containing protein [Ideonella azotifigens]MCD2341854.1 DUF2326 domain-containing protein [Ideonella azotifigens]